MAHGALPLSLVRQQLHDYTKTQASLARTQDRAVQAKSGRRISPSHRRDGECQRGHEVVRSRD
jgi:hypothetical protein